MSTIEADAPAPAWAGHRQVAGRRRALAPARGGIEAGDSGPTGRMGAERNVTGACRPVVLLFPGACHHQLCGQAEGGEETPLLRGPALHDVEAGAVVDG